MTTEKLTADDVTRLQEDLAANFGPYELGTICAECGYGWSKPEDEAHADWCLVALWRKALARLEALEQQQDAMAHGISAWVSLLDRVVAKLDTDGLISPYEIRGTVKAVRQGMLPHIALPTTPDADRARSEP